MYWILKIPMKMILEFWIDFVDLVLFELASLVTIPKMRP